MGHDMSKSQNLNERFSRFSFPIILLIGFVDYLGIGLVYPIFAVLLFDATHPIVPLNASPEYRGAMLGILIALTPISQFFCAPILGAFSDKRGRKIALIIGISIGCLGYILAVVAIYIHSLMLLFLYRFLLGLSDATAAVAQATIVDMSTKENKAKRLGYLNSSLGFGFTIGPLVGGIIADSALVSWFNYSTPFIGAGLLSLINLLLVIWHFTETKQDRESHAFPFTLGIQNIHQAFFIPHLRWFFAAGFAFSFGWAYFNTFISVLLKERFGFALGHIGQYYAFMGGWYSIGALMIGPFISKCVPEKILARSLCFAAACMLVFIMVEHSFYIWWITPFMMSSLAFAYPTATTLISNQANSQSQGKILGMYQSVGAAAMGLSPLLAGPVVGAYPYSIAWGGALSLILASFGFWIGNQKAREEVTLA